jgi:hypothetical protein
LQINPTAGQAKILYIKAQNYKSRKYHHFIATKEAQRFEK